MRNGFLALLFPGCVTPTGQAFIGKISPQRGVATRYAVLLVVTRRDVPPILESVVLKNLIKLALLVCLALGAVVASAGEKEIRKGLDTLFKSPGQISEINKMPYGDFHEVVLKSGEVLYVHSSGKFFFQGSLIDVEKRQDVSALRENERSRIVLADLPLDQAIKQVHGNGKRTLVTFEDPNCGYCKLLAKDLRNMKDVTIYTFMIAILSPDSAAKSKNIWCAENRAKAWNDWMVDGKVPAAGKCDDPAAKNLEMANKFRIRGTPAIYLADGTRAGGGYLPPAKLEEAVNNAENRKARPRKK